MHLFVMKKELISYIVIVKSIVLIDHVISVNYGLVREKVMFNDNENLIFNNAVKSIMNALKPPEALLNYKRKLIYRKYRIKKGIKKRYLLIYNPVIEILIDNYLFSSRILKRTNRFLR